MNQDEPLNPRQPWAVAALAHGLGPPRVATPAAVGGWTMLIRWCAHAAFASAVRDTKAIALANLSVQRHEAARDGPGPSAGEPDCPAPHPRTA